MRSTFTSTLAPRRRASAARTARGRAAARHGTAAIEMLLILLVMFGFALMVMAGWKVRKVHVKVRQDTHRDVFAETIRLLPDAPTARLPGVDDFFGDPDTAIPGLPTLDDLFTIGTPSIDTSEKILLIPFPGTYRVRVQRVQYWHPPLSFPDSWPWNPNAPQPVLRTDVRIWRQWCEPNVPDFWNCDWVTDSFFPRINVMRGDFDPWSIIGSALSGTINLGVRDMFENTLNVPDPDLMVDVTADALVDGEVNLLDLVQGLTGWDVRSQLSQFYPPTFADLASIIGVDFGNFNPFTFRFPRPENFLTFTSLTLTWPAFGDQNSEHVKYDDFTSEGGLDGKFGDNEDWNDYDLAAGGTFQSVLAKHALFRERPGQGFPRRVELYTGVFGGKYERLIGAPRVSTISPNWTWMITPVVPTNPPWNIMTMRNWYKSGLDGALDMHYLNGDAGAGDDGFRKKCRLQDYE
jgi:hypothetical protein